MNKEEILDLINRAKFIYVGVEGRAGRLVYFRITHEVAVSRAAEIAGSSNFTVKLGCEELGIRDTLYIEAA
jgi:hypothetical protein